MFLFLSKLLPVFLYPLGLSCVLMLVTLVLLWRKKPRQAMIPVLLTLVLLLISSNAWVSTWLVRSLETQSIPPADLPKADAIVVLGGAIKAPEAPRPWIDVLEEGDRVLHGAKLFRDGKAPKLILSGGRIDWLDSGATSTPGSESADMAELMKTMGVPESAMLQDPTSLNTYENAVNVKRIMETNKIQRILLVTSAIHMPRSLKIFQKLGIDAIPAPTDFLSTNREHQEFSKSFQSIALNAVPETERLRMTTRVLKEYLGIVVYWLKGWI